MSATKTIADRTRRKRRKAADALAPPNADKIDQRGVHDSLVGAVGRWILGSVYSPGHLLPQEDDLAEKLGVTRTSIREAVKVLSLHARRRVGVRVREGDEWDLLNSLVLSWHPDVGRDEALKTSLREARSIIEPAAAALATKRATPADLVRIEQAYLGMERNVRTDLEA
jgi:GntR family transcriptional regulator, galactonate operon transcriptional repressor